MVLRVKQATPLTTRTASQIQGTGFFLTLSVKYFVRRQISLTSITELTCQSDNHDAQRCSLVFGRSEIRWSMGSCQPV